MLAPQQKRYRPPEIRRKQILDAAKDCFCEIGFAQTRIADIADNAKISVGLVYRLFPSKEAIVEAIAVDFMDEQTQYLLESLEAHSGDLYRMLYAMIDSYKYWLRDKKHLTLVTEIFGETCRNENIVAIVAEQRKAIFKLMRNYIAPTAAPSAKLKDLEIRLQVMGGLVLGVGLQLAAKKSEPSLELIRLVEDVSRYVIEPLRNESK